ncbi:MAG: translocation/assembly module TamB [Flavobacteriales bacterium]|nr:translocation/assembly module TamB [Flavobacteriales bacterium]
MASYNSSFQTTLVKQYLKSLAKKLDTDISVGSIDVSLFNKLIITDLYVEDLHQDTLLYAKRLVVDIKEFSLKEKKIILDEVELTNAFFNLQKYKGEEGTNLSFIIKHFAITDTTKSKWIFKLNNAELNKIRFDYDNNNYEELLAGVDYKHISITYLNLSVSEIDFVNKGIDCKINQLKFFEKSGFQVDEFTAEVNVTPSGIIAQHLKVKTPYSTIDGNVTFLTDDYASLSNFIDDVTIKSYFNSTKVDFKDICYFAPALNCLNKSVNFEGEIKGRVSKLKGRKLSILTDDGTRFKGDVDISGLPSAQDMFMHIRIKELITTKEKLESIPLFPFVKETFIKLPKNFRYLGTIRFKGSFTGFYHDFVTYGTLKTSLGNLTTDVSLKLKDGKPRYKGKIISNHFDLGRFAEMREDIGDITMNVNINGEGFSKETVDATLTGNINQIVIKDYEYNNVEVKGNFKNQIFAGFLAVEDENISFDFDGSIDLSKKLPEIKFVSNIENAKLAKLNLVKSKKKLKTRFSTQLRVDLIGNNIDDVVGEVEFINSRYHDKLDSIKVERVLITSVVHDKHRDIIVKSDLLDAKLEGEFYFKEITDFADNFFARYIPSQIDDENRITNLSHDFNFNVEFHNSELVSKVLLKGIKMSENTSLEGKYNSKDHNLSISGDSPFIDAFGTEINHFNFNIKANEKTLDISIDVDKIYQNDSLYVDNFNISSITEKDSVLTKIKWNNNGELSRNEANINIETIFNGYNHISSKITDSYAYVSDTLWKVKPYNEIKNDTGSLFVRGLTIYSKTQSMLIDGTLSDNPNDQLDMLLKNFDLLTFKKIIPEKVISLEGIINGVASVKKHNNELIFTSDLVFDKFRINDNLIGKGNLQSIWNTANQSLKLDGKFYRDHIPTILFGGYYYPNKEAENLDLTLELYQTELSMFDAYTKDFLSGFNGRANANVSLTGTLQKPKLRGNLTLQNTDFTVIYLNTKYRTNLCKINITPDMISFDNIEFLDEKNNVAVANGTVYHTWFSDWSIDIGLDVKNFLALNTTERDNSLYYGRAFVTGFVDIGSYDKQLNIDVDIKTEKNTTLNIPLSDSKELVENNFIEFISKDSTNLKVELEEDVDLSNIEMNFDLEITPDAQVRLIFDDQIGDVMRSRGSGNLKLQINNDGDLNMYGKYFVKDGDYLFTLQNVINKRFDLEEGGTISWNGSPYNAEINLTAVYRLRARLYDLLANIDTNDIYKKRIPVDLKLRMRNEMMNPDISFDIHLPTADEDTRSKVRSVLYVNDKEENIQELNKQVFSLLVLNTFLPPPGAESTYNASGVGTSTSIEMFSNQISNWLSKISNDFDIGVNIRPGDELSNEEYELALSTQLFNDRLVLDGNLGYSDRENVSNEAQNTNNLIGDISLEYKITKDGRLRAKAFNNSNQFSLEETNSPYTQGLGLSYKVEYDTNKDFWKKFFSIFGGKNKKD